jgi:hypothetical protein
MVTGIHKLNTDFFDPHYSCASLFVAGSVSGIPICLLEHPLVNALVSRLIRLAPMMAASFEIFIPIPLILSVWYDTRSQHIVRTSLLIGAFFHAVLALPPSPLSVYPFSSIMVPIYVMAIPENCRLETLVSRWLFGNRILQGVLIVLIGVASAIGPKLLFDEDHLFEYPDYGLWGASLIWNTVAWIFVIASLISTSSEAEIKNRPTSRPPNRIGMRLSTMILLASLLIFGLTPYIGLRNYPALAMFANLRTEGPNPNHWLGGFDLFNYQKDYVEVTSTDIDSILKMQINLGEMFPTKLKKVNDMFGLSNEFYICPPRWPIDEAERKFKPFKVPFIELRRRLSGTVLSGFVKYTRFRPDGTKTDEVFYSNHLDQNPDVMEPLSWFEQFLVKFRTFSDDYSPCRH